MSKRKISSLLCDEVMPDEETLNKDDLQKRPGYEDDYQRKCPKCRQLIVEDCVMCAQVSRDWREGDPDERYTAFWKSAECDKAIANGPKWNWETYANRNDIFFIKENK